MDRRQFFKTGLAAGTVATAGLAIPSMAKPAAPARLFEVRTRVEVASPQSATNIYVPLFDSRNVQDVRSQSWQSELPVALHNDAESGTRLLHLTAEHGAPAKLEIIEHVATWDQGTTTSSAISDAERAQFGTLRETGADRDAIVAKAAEITAGLTTPRAKLRAIHDWVIANTFRDPATRNCGRGDVGQMLRDGQLGGKCADLNGLVVCLARASGMPARENFGIRLAESSIFPSLGATGNITGAQHCRAEVWLEGEGWLTIDPADVRKAILQEELPADHPEIVALADRLFGNAESNWAAYNSASNISLPGAAHPGHYRFLLYPTAIDSEGTLERDRIDYNIEVSEIIA